MPMQRLHVSSSPIAWRVPPSSSGLVVALVRLALDERLAEEAETSSWATVRDGLERRRREEREVERRSSSGRLPRSAAIAASPLMPRPKAPTRAA